MISHTPPPRSLFEHFIKSVYEGAAIGLATVGLLLLMFALAAVCATLYLLGYVLLS